MRPTPCPNVFACTSENNDLWTQLLVSEEPRNRYKPMYRSNVPVANTLRSMSVRTERGSCMHYACGGIIHKYSLLLPAHTL